MRHGWAGRLVALACVVALAAASGAVELAPTSSSRRTMVAGTVLEREANRPSRSSAVLDSIGRLRQPESPAVVEAGTAAPAGDAVIAPPPEAFDQPAETPPPPPPALQRAHFEDVQPAGGTWALVVGINDYPGSKYDLRSALADAEDVNTALAKLGIPGDRRVVLRDTRANGNTIRAGLDWLVAHAGPHATAVFFYAGHIRKLGGGTEALIASDGAVITDREVADRLATLQARRAWIALAACYAGGFNELLGPGRILTGAAPSDSLAYENGNFGRSYLVEYMIRRAIIEGRADATIEAAFRYAEAGIRRDYPNRVPVQFDNADGETDLRPASRTSGSPTPSSPPPGGTAGPSDGGSNQPPPSPPPDEPEPCTAVTGGIVRCGSD